jgi:multiple sugar transport system permease protein
MYVICIVGSAWMVYPFLLMVSGSVKSEVDMRKFDIFPRYVHDDVILFRKFEEQRYGGQLDAFTAACRYSDTNARPLSSFEFLPTPTDPPTAVLADWNEFTRDCRSWPRHYLQLGHNFGYKTFPEVTLEYQHRLWEAFPDVPKIQLATAPQRLLIQEKWQTRAYQSVQGPYAPIYDKLRSDLPDRYFVPTAIEGTFVTTLLQSRYGTGTNGVAKLNKKWGTNFASVFDASLNVTPPTQAGQRDDWWEFVRTSLSARFIRLDDASLLKLREFLREKYKDIAKLNTIYGAAYPDWSAIHFEPTRAPIAAYADVEGFVQTLASPEGLSLDGPEFRWREFVKTKYGDLAAFNQAHGTDYTSFDHVKMPLLAADWAIMKANRWPIVREYLTRNYRVVWDYLSVQGRAVQNTIIFVVLNIVTALIVNPLAAYALSRFQPRWSYKALFLLMATMAFPGEVTQIPAFLLLRDLGFLNTFAALVIPAAANGYSIFLLKGFFDSLPKDLYESATLDGAGEFRVFFTITMPLSAPILAVIALGAFTSAYGAFMFALLVCQKQTMWTIMVYIYQLQQLYNVPIVFASLVIAAIPTLIVFTLCQNVIMRGIVVPVEK